MRCILAIGFVALIGISLPGCTSAAGKNDDLPGVGDGAVPAGEKPAWVSDPYAGFAGDDGKFLAAIGQAKAKSPAIQQAQAVDLGRQRIAALLQAKVRRFVDDYETAAQGFKDESTPTAIEKFDRLSRLVVNEALLNAQGKEFWKDHTTNTLYALVVLNWNDFAAAYKKNGEIALRERFFQKSSEMKDASLAALEAQMDREEQTGFSDVARPDAGK